MAEKMSSDTDPKQWSLVVAWKASQGVPFFYEELQPRIRVSDTTLIRRKFQISQK